VRIGLAFAAGPFLGAHLSTWGIDATMWFGAGTYAVSALVIAKYLPDTKFGAKSDRRAKVKDDADPSQVRSASYSRYCQF
jgi:hypothetical protein